MGKDNKLNRRSFLYGQIAVASTIGLCGTAYARGQTQAPNKISRDTLPLGDAAPLSWKTGTADQFAALIDQPFTAMTRDGNQLHLTLIQAEAGNSGPARPKNLARSESVSLLFKSDFAADLAAQGHQSVWIWHDTLGEFHVLLGTVPRRSGGFDFEAVLN